MKKCINEPPILSSAQAEKESRRLKSMWSEESLLSLRTLIYCASLLERLASKKGRKQRKVSAWSKFLGEQLRAGKTIQEAAAIYRANGKKA